MPLACTKQFSLTIASSSDVYACYPCDEPNKAAALVDRVSGFNMQWVSVPTTSVPGKIGNAVRIGFFPGPIAAEFSSPFVGFDSHWDLSATSFTIRFWINIFYDVTTAMNTTILQILSGDGCFVYLNNSDLAIHFAVDLGGSTVDLTGPPVTMPGWHRIVAWHEKGVGLGLKIDNGASVLLANTGSQISKPRALTIAGGGAGNATYEYIDDIAIWRRKLTDAELLTDWSSGVGKSCATTSLPAVVHLDAGFLACLNGYGCAYTGTIPLINSDPLAPLYREVCPVHSDTVDISFDGVTDFCMVAVVGGGFATSGWRRNPHSSTDPTGSYAFFSGAGLTGYPPGIPVVT